MQRQVLFHLDEPLREPCPLPWKALWQGRQAPWQVSQAPWPAMWPQLWERVESELAARPAGTEGENACIQANIPSADRVPKKIIGHRRCRRAFPQASYSR